MQYPEHTLNKSENNDEQSGSDSQNMKKFSCAEVLITKWVTDYEGTILDNFIVYADIGENR